jgi:hypothetical protein
MRQTGGRSFPYALSRRRLTRSDRELEIERFFSIRVDLRRVATFHTPNDKRPQDVAQKLMEVAEVSDPYLSFRLRIQ